MSSVNKVILVDTPDYEMLMALCEQDWGVGRMPIGPLVVSLGVDVQGDGVYVEKLGHGPRKETWQLDARFIPGATDVPGEGAWRALDDYSQRGTVFPGGRVLPIDWECVDAGYHTPAAQAYCARRPRRLAVFGRPGWGRPILGRGEAIAYEQQGRRAGRAAGGKDDKAYLVGTFNAKLSWYGFLKATVKAAKEAVESATPEVMPVGRVHLSKDTPPDWFEQATAETIEVRFVNGYEGEHAALVQRNHHLIRKTYGKACRGAPIKLGGYGDSITGLQGGAVPPYTANGDSRDRVGYLGSYPTDTRNSVPKYDLGRGVTDNVKIGWNWAIKAALDAIAGSEQVTYLNYGIGSTTSAATQSGTPGDGRDNGLYPPRIAVPLAAGLDLVVIAFGMNERGSLATYANLVNMVGQFLAVGTEVALLGCPRPSSAFIGNSTSAWRYTEDAIEAAAYDAGAAYISTAAIADDRNLGAIGLPAEALGATNISVAGNHPGLFELAQYGRACVTQLGL